MSTRRRAGAAGIAVVYVSHRMNEILSAHTGRPLAQIAADTERDYYMGAPEAKDYGIVDVVAKSRAALLEEVAK